MTASASAGACSCSAIAVRWGFAEDNNREQRPLVAFESRIGIKMRTEAVLGDLVET